LRYFLTVGEVIVVAEFPDIDQSRSVPSARRNEASRQLVELKRADRGWTAVVVGEGNT